MIREEMASVIEFEQFVFEEQKEELKRWEQ